VIGIQLHFSFAQIMREREIPIKNDEMTFRYKPDGGFWTSTWREETQDSEWVEWCRGENFASPDESNWFLLTPKEDSKLYVIDTYADLERLLAYYPWTSPLAKSLPRESYLLKYYTGIDFERLAQDYDGLHLTYEGNNRLHLSYPLNLNGWDAESTVWFRWCFTEVRHIETPKLVETTV